MTQLGLQRRHVRTVNPGWPGNFEVQRACRDFRFTHVERLVNLG
jgi:hypothetical protein